MKKNPVFLVCLDVSEEEFERTN